MYQFLSSDFVFNKKNVSNNWWRNSASTWELLSTCAENHFESKLIFNEKRSLLSFCDLEWKRKWLLTNFLCTVDKTAFCASRSHIWSFLDCFSIFSPILSFEIEIFHTHSKKCSAQLSTLYFRCTNEQMMKIWIYAEKCNKFSSVKAFKKKVSRSFGGTVRHSRESFILLLQRIILKTKQDCRRRRFFIIFGFRAQKKFQLFSRQNKILSIYSNIFKCSNQNRYFRFKIFLL